MNLYQYVNFATRNERIVRSYGTSLTSSDPNVQADSMIDAFGLNLRQALNARNRGLISDSDYDLPSASHVMLDFGNAEGPYSIDTRNRDNATMSTILQTGKNMTFPERKAWRTRVYENNRARKAMGMDGDLPINSYKYDANLIGVSHGDQDFLQKGLAMDKMRETTNNLETNRGRNIFTNIPEDEVKQRISQRYPKEYESFYK